MRRSNFFPMRQWRCGYRVFNSLNPHLDWDPCVHWWCCQQMMSNMAYSHSQLTHDRIFNHPLPLSPAFYCSLAVFKPSPSLWQEGFCIILFKFNILFIKLGYVFMHIAIFIPPLCHYHCRSELRSAQIAFWCQ